MKDIFLRPTTRQCRPMHCVFRLCRLSIQILVARYLMNGCNSIDKTDREYSLTPADYLIRFWRSNVKVTASEGSHVDAAE